MIESAKKLAVGDRMCRVVGWNIWKSDRRSRIQMKFKEILTGRTSEVTAQPDDRYDVLDAEVIDLEHSYRDGPDEIFYTKTGEEWRFPAAGLEDVLRWVSPTYRGQVVDGKLVIEFTSGVLFDKVKDLTFKVGAKNLNSIQVDGAANVEGKNIATENLLVKLNGAGAMTLSGKSTEQNVALDGVGTYNAAELSSQRAQVTNNGTGAVVVRVSDKLDAIAKALLEFETLDGAQIKEIIKHGRMLNPPPGVIARSGEKMEPEKPPKQVVVAPDVTPPLPGALGGAPA